MPTSPPSTGSVISHVTALRLYGFETGPPWPLHVSTRSATHSRLPGICTHRRLARISTRKIDGVLVTGPNRTLVDIATRVDLVTLIQAAEHMIHAKHTTLDDLTTYASSRHLDGVRRLRRVLGVVREESASPMETLVRLMLVLARLPEPGCNVNIRDEHGAFLARGDLVYARWKVVVEYDGWQHERDARQRQWDLIRREQLEAAGWRVIVVTVGDLSMPKHLVRRVHAALVARGYAGPRPVFSVMWERWFLSPRPT